MKHFKHPFVIFPLLLLLGTLIVITLFAPKNPSPTQTKADSGSEQGTTRINDDNSNITYSGPWARKTSTSLDYHHAPAPLSGATIGKNLGASASLSFTGTKVTMGTLTWINRGIYDIFIDGAKVDTFNAYSAGVTPKTWTSETLICKTHTIKVSQSDTPGANGGKGIVLDYFAYTPCTPQVNSPSHDTPPDPTKCQGNINAPAKCFDCKKDSPEDQLNILDFACFAKYYGKTVGI